MALLFYEPRTQVLDGNGDPYAGARLHFYETGTSTPLDTYSDEALSTANPNPVAADANGRFGAIFLKPQSYKAVLKDSSGATIWTQDPVNGAMHDLAGDATPQLGGQLDVNGKAFGDGTLELLEFTETAGAVNHLGIENAAAGGDPELGIGATGTEADVGIKITPKGTGEIKPGPTDFQDNILRRPEFKDYAETVNAIGATGGGTRDIDLTLGNVVTATVDTSAAAFTFSNPPATGIAGSFTLILTNGGSQTVAWPASVDWAGGTAPPLTAAGVDVLTFCTTDAGTTWYGFAAGLDMK